MYWVMVDYFLACLNDKAINLSNDDDLWTEQQVSTGFNCCNPTRQGLLQTSNNQIMLTTNGQSRLQTYFMIMIWVNNGDGEGYFEEDGYDCKDVNAAADDDVEYYSIASDIVGYMYIAYVAYIG